jgi:hypothetical protein
MPHLALVGVAPLPPGKVNERQGGHEDDDRDEGHPPHRYSWVGVFEHDEKRRDKDGEGMEDHT